MRSFVHRLTTIAAAVVLTGAAACSETAVTAPSAPVGGAVLPPAAMATYSSLNINFKTLYPTLATQVPSSTWKGDTSIQKFTVNPADGKLIVFGNSAGVIAIPANTLCDPTRTSYGPGEWKKPCSLAKTSINFEVRIWLDAQGRPRADFSPDIRFSPAATSPVRLFLQDHTLSNFSRVYIPYCDAFNVCTNEGATDSFLETYYTPLPGSGYWVYRNLRHFSGYTVTAD